MLDITDRFAVALPGFQQLPQSLLSLPERQAANIRSIDEQQIEREENEIIGLAVGNGGLQAREIRRAIVVERDNLAIDQHIRKLACLFRDAFEFAGPIQTFSG